MTEANGRDDGWGWVQRVRDELGSRLAGLEPGQVHARDAASLMDAFAEIECLAAAGKSAMAARVSRTLLWRRTGERSPAEWMARRTGTSVGQAKAALATAHKLEELPQVKEAVLTGKLSPSQANEVVGAATADPSAEASLLLAAEHESMAGLKQRCQQVKAAACTDEIARYEAIRRQRSFRTWTSRDGAFRFDGSMTPDAGARLLARLQPEAERRFAEARRQGRRESSEAWAADALEALVAAAPGPRRGGEGHGAVVHRKGGKTVTIPLAPRTARVLDLAIGERIEDPIFLGLNACASPATPRRGRLAGTTGRALPTSLAAQGPGGKGRFAARSSQLLMPGNSGDSGTTWCPAAISAWPARPKCTRS
jgi:hypothetical protein